MLPVNDRRVRRRAAQGLFFLLVLSTLISCAIPHAKEKNREDALREHVRRFHWAMIGQDVPVALQYVPSDDREAWEDAFTCLFKQIRLLDYRVSLVEFDDRSKTASVQVRWTGNPPDSLVAKETGWKEEWSFDPMKERWTFRSGPEALKGLPEDCVPEVPDRETSDEDESAD